jgi:hypothetical protein
MSFFIAISVFIFNEFAKRLIEKGFNKFEEDVHKNLIYDRISTFNSKFVGSELDGNAFERFIQLDETQSNIFNQVFSINDVTRINEKSFIDKLAHDAFEFINSIYSKNDIPLLVNTRKLGEYFTILLTELIHLRKEILNPEHTAQTAIIVDAINKIDEKIDNSINQSKHNVFADEKINEVKLLVNKYNFSEALTQINVLMEEQRLLSDKQVENVLYQKCRVYILTHKHDELIKATNKLRNINDKSPYLLELEYSNALSSKDERLFNKLLGGLRENSEDEDLISIKQASFYFYKGEEAAAVRMLTDENGLSSRFKISHEARYIYGMILARGEKYEEAIKEFASAYTLEEKYIYLYHEKITRALYILTKNDSSLYTQETLTEVTCLIDDLLELNYMLEYFVSNSVEGFWNIVLELALIENKRFFKIIQMISKEFIETVSIQSKIAAQYCVDGEFMMAKEILKDNWHILPINTLNYFRILEIEKNWSEMLEKCSTLSPQEVDSSPILKFYETYAKLRTQGYSEVRSELAKLIYAYPNNFVILKKLIEAAKEFSDHDFLFEIITNIHLNADAFPEIGLSELAAIMAESGRPESALDLLLNRINESEKLLKRFLSIIRSIEFKEISDKYVEKLEELYEKGIRDRDLCIYLAVLNVESSKYLNALTIIDSYVSNYGMSEDIASIKMACKLNLNDRLNTEDALEILKVSQNPYNIQLVAIYYAKIGEFEEAQKYLLRSIYKVDSEFDSDFIERAISVYFSNIDKHKEKFEFDKVVNNTVVSLQNGDTIVNIAVHGDSLLEFIPGEERFGCVNYNKDHQESILLKLTGEKGKGFIYQGKNYIITKIIDVNVYFSRHCLELHSKFPDESLSFKQFHSSSTEDLIEKIRTTLKPYDMITHQLLEEYNFSDRIGRPLNHLSGHNHLRYIDAIFYLLLESKQFFYAGLSEHYPGGLNLFTLSSIVLAVFYKVDQAILNSESELIIAESTKNLIVSCAEESSRTIDSVSAHITTSETKSLKTSLYMKEDKDFIKNFWAKMVEFVHNPKVRVISSSIDYEFIPRNIIDVFLYCDIESMQICKTNSFVLVSEDKFVKNVFLELDNNQKCNNFAGFIYSEKMLNTSDRDKLTKDLVEAKYLFPVSSYFMLSTIRDIKYEKSEEILNTRIEIWIEIFERIFDNESRPYYKSMYDELTSSFTEFDLTGLDLFVFLQRPFNLSIQL